MTSTRVDAPCRCVDRGPIEGLACERCSLSGSTAVKVGRQWGRSRLCRNHADAVLREYPDADLDAFDVVAPCRVCPWCQTARLAEIAAER